MLQIIWQIIDQFFTLQSSHFTFLESEFDVFKQDHSQRLLDSFFDMALGGITVAFVFRILILRSSNAILDLILPFVIMMFITILYYINKNTNQMKHYFHIICIPVVGLLSARKTVSQDAYRFFLNESFASWLIMMIFGSFSSPKQWYQVVAINFFCFFSYISIVFKQYGLKGIGNDFYVHITTTIIFSACLIRMNELNLRNSFNLLSMSKIQEKKWQRVLTLLTDGVLIMQHTDNEKGILLINPSLQKIFGKQKIEEKENEININTEVHTCGQNIEQIDKILEQNQIQIIKENALNGKQNIASALKQGFCMACENERQQSQNQQKENNVKDDQHKKLKAKAKEAEDQATNKRRFNEKRVGPIFDELFRNIKFRIVLSEKNIKGKNGIKQDRHSKEVQFLNDFICKQMEFFQKELPQGYSEHLFLKVLEPNRIIELNIVKLDEESQVLFLFKEVSVYNRLSKARTTEKFSNILINSIAHNLFTPLNALIQLTKSMSDIIVGVNQVAEKNVQMIGICLQQLVFTTHNILEMSKIRQGRFKKNTKPVDITDKLECIFDFFKDDMKFREIEHEIKCQDQVKNFMIILDDPRFSIVLYNLISNCVKHTNGGSIKVSVKLLSQQQLDLKREKIQRLKLIQEEQEKNNVQIIKQKEEEQEEENSLSSANTINKSTPQKNQENTEDEQTDNDGTGKNKIQLEDKVYLSVSVGDTGVGMTSEMRKKCFTLFGNLKIKKDVNQGGMGLGLASANLICKALKGELNLIRSDLNEGSKFNFYLPVAQGKLILGKNKKNKEQSSSEESEKSDDNYSNSQQQKKNRSFENKKAQIINNIRIQQQQEKKKQNNDAESDDNSASNDSEESSEYSQKQDFENNSVFDEEQEEEYDELYGSEEGMEDEQNEFSDNIQNHSYLQQQQVIEEQLVEESQVSSSKFKNKYSDESLASSKQNQNKIRQQQRISNNINQLKSKQQNQGSQRSSLSKNSIKSQYEFKLKKQALILSQNFDTEEINIQSELKNNQLEQKKNQQIKEQRNENKLKIQQKNNIKKSDPCTPYSQNSDSFESNESDPQDSFVKFLNSSSNNHHISSLKSKNKLQKKFKFDKSPSVRVPIQNIQQNGIFKEKQLSFNKLKHHIKNPFSSLKINLNQISKIQFQKKNQKDSSESISSIIDNVNEIYEINKFSNTKNKSAKYNTEEIHRSSSMNSISNEFQILLSNIDNTDSNKQKNAEDQMINNSLTKNNSYKQKNQQKFIQMKQRKNQSQNIQNIPKTELQQKENKKSKFFQYSPSQKQSSQDNSSYQDDDQSNIINKKQEDKQVSKQNGPEININLQQQIIMNLDESSFNLLKKSKSANLSFQKTNNHQRFSDSIQILEKNLSHSQPYIENDNIAQDSIENLEKYKQYQNTNEKKKDNKLIQIQKDNNQKFISSSQQNVQISQSINLVQKNIQQLNSISKLPPRDTQNQAANDQVYKQSYSQQLNKQSSASAKEKSSKLNSQSSQIQDKNIIKAQNFKKIDNYIKKKMKLNSSKDQDFIINQNNEQKTRKSSVIKEIEIKDKQNQLKNKINSQKNSLQSQKCNSSQKEKQNSPMAQNINLNQILIVDDTVFNIQILQMIFKSRYQIETDQAVSGEEAIMKCQQRTAKNQETYKMIVMDINMPGMDGVVATNKIREFNDPYVKKIDQKDYIIVAHTAIPEDQFGDFKKKGFDGFLQKPIDHDQLLKFLKKVHLK